jgi:hypothetical protein
MKTKTKRSSPSKLITKGPNDQLSHDDIAFAAYCLWKHEGHREGHDLEDWFRAENLLRQASQQVEVEA